MKVVSESHVKRTDRVGILELFFCVLAAYLNPRKWHDMVPIYCPPCPVCQESQARRKRESCPKQGLAGECFGLLPLAQMKQLRSSSCVRIRAVLGSELDPACAWLSLAGSRPIKGKQREMGGFRCLKIKENNRWLLSEQKELQEVSPGIF